MSLVFNMLSRLVITFLPRSKRLLISWLQSPSAVILEPPKIKSDTVSTVSPSRDSSLSLSLSLSLFLSLAIPKFRLLSQVRALRFSLGHSGLVLTLSNAARSSPFSPCLLVVDASIWGTSMLGVAVRHVICGFYLFIFPPGYVALWDSKTPHRPAGERVSWCLETSLLRLPSRDGSPSLTLLSLYLLYFVLCPFENNGLLFWVPDVLCQCSEVVLWSLLSVQMFFQ